MSLAWFPCGRRCIAQNLNSVFDEALPNWSFKGSESNCTRCHTVKLFAPLFSQFRVPLERMNTTLGIFHCHLSRLSLVSELAGKEALGVGARWPSECCRRFEREFGWLDVSDQLKVLFRVFRFRTETHYPRFPCDTGIFAGGLPILIKEGDRAVTDRWSGCFRSGTGSDDTVSLTAFFTKENHGNVHHLFSMWSIFVIGRILHMSIQHSDTACPAGHSCCASCAESA